MTTWLVTGGAGYIGAHVVRALQAKGLAPVVLDDLSSGVAAFVPPGVPFVQADIRDTASVSDALRDYGCTGVIHVAGFKYAGVSVQRPLHTYAQNVTGTASVLEAMADAGVNRIVFSSSAAVYGTPDTELVTEDSPNRPESPYGESKLIGEWLINDVARSTEGFRGVSLRYFNVVGSATDEVYDVSPHNLFPLVIEALLAGRTPRINGVDYPTPDGTGVRDYIHVVDLAKGHVAALKKLESGAGIYTYNLGTGVGYSVLDMLHAFEKACGKTLPYELVGRRPGDIAVCYADPEKAATELGWRAEFGVERMCADAWRWQSNNPNGFDD